MIKYPAGSKPSIEKTKSINKSRLGQNFEDLINKSNEYYLLNNIAIIHKKPTPIQITKVDYPSRHSAKITEAFYKIPSTTDYNGIYKGKYIDFEAKSCNGKSFSFSHIYVHQITHLSQIVEHGGIAFLLILFNDYQEVFLLPAELLMQKYQDSLNNGRKSISYDYFKENAYCFKIGYIPPVDFIKAIDYTYKKVLL